MPLSAARIAELARHLETAARERRTVPKLADMEPQLTLADAYDVQWALRDRRGGRGGRVFGVPNGRDSPAAVEHRRGGSAPCWGPLRRNSLAPASLTPAA